MKTKISVILTILIIFFSINGKSQIVNTDPSHDYSVGFNMGQTLAGYLATGTAAQISGLLNQYAVDYDNIYNNLDAPAAAAAFSSGFQAGLNTPINNIYVTPSPGSGGSQTAHLSSLTEFNTAILNGTVIPGSGPEPIIGFR